jgi:hypothetical protein
MPKSVDNPNRLSCAYEIDELNLQTESVSITLHRSIVGRMAKHLLTMPMDDQTKINKSIRSLGHNLDLANKILHGSSTGGHTIFEGIIIDANESQT